MVLFEQFTISRRNTFSFKYDALKNQTVSCDDFLPRTHAHSHTQFVPARTSHARVRFAKILIALAHARVRLCVRILAKRTQKPHMCVCVCDWNFGKTHTCVRCACGRKSSVRVCVRAIQKFGTTHTTHSLVKKHR